jgi:hypothetical protein
MAFACYTDRNGTIGVFRTREQAEKRNEGPAYSPKVVEVLDHEHTTCPVPSRGVFFHPRDQSYPILVSDLWTACFDDEA